MKRKEILETAAHIVSGQRETDYGPPEDSFQNIAALWSAYLGTNISSIDVTVMMILLKVARMYGGAGTDDTWVDIAGYAACGGEIDTERSGEE